MGIHATVSHADYSEDVTLLPMFIATLEREISRRWEQGDDMSMVDFRCAEYSDGKVVADKETRKRIMEIGSGKWLAKPEFTLIP